MTDHAEILRGLYDETLVGNKPRVLELTHEGLATGLTPESMLFDAVIEKFKSVAHICGSSACLMLSRIGNSRRVISRRTTTSSWSTSMSKESAIYLFTRHG